VIIRFLAAVFFAIVLNVFGILLIIGHKKGQPFAPWRNFCIGMLSKFVCRGIIHCGPNVFIKFRRPTVDYAQYLGPDWKPVYEGASTIVGNH
jgi:hypothetical protein